MKNWKIITIVSVAAIVAALLASSAFAAAMMGGGGYGGYGGMMGGGYGTGYGNNNPPYSTGTTIPSTPTGQYYQPVYPFQFGGGMMGRLGNGYGFGGMMRGYGYAAPYTYNGATLNITTATTIAQNYVASIGNPDLTVKQVEEYQANFYVQVTRRAQATAHLNS